MKSQKHIHATAGTTCDPYRPPSLPSDDPTQTSQTHSNTMEIAPVSLISAGTIEPHDPSVCQSLVLETSRRIQSQYNEGMLFFTKKTMREIMAQVEACRGPDGQLVRGREIFLPKAGGGTQVTKLETGMVVSLALSSRGDQNQDYECIAGEPILHYKSYQSLSAHLIHPYLCMTDVAHTPIHPMYPLIRRRKSTGQLAPEGELDDPAKLSTAFTAFRQRWEASVACRKFKARLSMFSIPPVKNIVAFACSNMNLGDRLQGKSRRGPWAQHALILALQQVLQDHSGSSVECSAQDPIYNSANKEVLAKNGIQVVQDPSGFLQVNDSSAVICVAPDIPVRQIITDIALPVMLIWTTVHDEEAATRSSGDMGGNESHLRADPESSRVRKMISEKYDKIWTLGGGAWTADFVLTSVYLRRY